jgi:phosphoribosylglycinamide formyltransferase-1
MGQLLNLVVELDERFASDAAARERIARAGCELRVERGADDRTLAWIDDTFGGAWSSEAFAAQNAIATRDEAPIAFAAFDPQGLRYAWLRGMAREPGVGIFGPFGVDPAERGGALGPALLELAFHRLRAQGHRRALIAAARDGLVPYYERHAGARVVERFDLHSVVPARVRTVVLASGSGTNFQAVIDRVAAGLPLDIAAVVSNKPQAFALERARRAGINAVALPWLRAEQSRAEYDAALLECVAQQRPELVLLLGWMHLLDPRFVDAFAQMVNVHPAFLPLDQERDIVGMPDGTTIPAFRGAHALRESLALGGGWAGASVHLVTARADRGRILVRKPLRILPGEDEAALLERLHPIEHELVERGIRRWLYEK